MIKPAQYAMRRIKSYDGERMIVTLECGCKYAAVTARIIQTNTHLLCVKCSKPAKETKSAQPLFGKKRTPFWVLREKLARQSA